VLAIFSLALSAAAFAQDFRQQVRATIPFSFYAGRTVMPAGNYTFAISRASFNIEIFQKDKAIGTFLLGSPHDGSTNRLTLLTFRANDEGVYMLQKLEGPDFGLSFGSEKRLEHVAADQHDNATQIVLAQVVK
jgi:hypothetical protein